MTPAESVTAWARDLHKAVYSQVVDGGNRIVGWLVVGNAGGMVIAFNAIVGGSTCDRDLVASSLRLFSAGLALGFVGAIVSWVGSILALGWFGDRKSVV